MTGNILAVSGGDNKVKPPLSAWREVGVGTQLCVLARLLFGKNHWKVNGYALAM